MNYLSIDLETTGLEGDSTLEIAAVLEDTECDEEVEDLPYFHGVGSPLKDGIGSVWSLPAMKMHAENGLLDELMLPDTPGILAVYDAFRYWLDMWDIKVTHKITAAGKNVGGFDLPRLPVSIRERFHHRVIDPGSVFMDWTKAVPPGMEDLMPGGRHRALEDARNVVRVLRRAYRTQ